MDEIIEELKSDQIQFKGFNKGLIETKENKVTSVKYLTSFKNDNKKEYKIVEEN